MPLPKLAPVALTPLTVPPTTDWKKTFPFLLSRSVESVTVTFVDPST